MKGEYARSACGTRIRAVVTRMGRDYTICVFDDKNGHIGSTAVSVARKSLTGEGISATTSVLNITGHKEEEIAREFSEAVAVKKNCTAVCTCGIHVDDINKEEIDEIRDACKSLCGELLCDLSRDF